MDKQNSTNTSQAMWIAIGSLCSFLFAIVSSAILSRYLAKDAYGTYKQVMYVYTTLLSVFTLGLPLAYSYFLPRVSIAEGKSLVDKINAVCIVLWSRCCRKNFKKSGAGSYSPDFFPSTNISITNNGAARNISHI